MLLQANNAVGQDDTASDLDALDNSTVPWPLTLDQTACFQWQMVYNSTESDRMLALGLVVGGLVLDNNWDYIDQPEVAQVCVGGRVGC